MGLGELGGPDMRFVRKFRFLISGDHLSNLFIFSAHISWIGKKIQLTVYEAYKDGNGIEIHNWADAMEENKYPDESMILTTLDGCGMEIYKRKFSGLKILERENNFDYSDSDISTHIVTLSYEKYEKLPVDTEIKTEMKKEPLAQVDHLNGRMWTP